MLIPVIFCKSIFFCFYRLLARLIPLSMRNRIRN
nr:MAG TPA: hypothetical protein [Caudoviricetes sp.]